MLLGIEMTAADGGTDAEDCDVGCMRNGCIPSVSMEVRSLSD